MSMSRKDFENVAARLKSMQESWGPRIPARVVAENFAELAMESNERFDRIKFMKAANCE